ncbi:MAG: endonuclease dU [Thermoplasmataceae archaeon]
MKQQGRILGVVGSGFRKDFDKSSILVFVMVRCPNVLESVVFSSAIVDGDDASEKIIQTFKTLSKTSISMILTSGIAFSGLNLCDPERINRETGVPFVSLSRAVPCLYCMEKAVEAMMKRNGSDMTMKKDILSRLSPETISINEQNYYINRAGIERTEVIHNLTICKVTGLLPEPLRIARIIASGLYEFTDLLPIH